MYTMPTPSHLVGLPAEIPVRELLSRLSIAVGGQLEEELLILEMDLAAIYIQCPQLNERVCAASQALDDLLDVWDGLFPPTQLDATGSEF